MTTPPPAPAGMPGSPLRPVLRGIARTWGWYLVLGVVSVVGGLAALLWPGVTLVVLAVMFGIVMVVDGIGAIADAIGNSAAGGGLRALLGVLGLLAVGLGIYSVLHIGLTIAVLGILLAVWWIAAGIRELVVGASNPGMPGRGWTIAMGVIDIVLGLVLAFWPGISIATMAMLAGIFLLVTGAMQIVLALQLRKLGQRVG